ncbi:hypothetical protein [Paenibacillus sp. Aloe-11]|uniref:hypothetical protein n=1 Tax=Paenibacillus sp. Aloe-11 TaxID=1050222 RepID=UPI00024EF5AD|nr:hypothetical protein [Paenibacillus sp. Aloe-11]EHS58311.1 hypothetical protein WG8_1571 [Paenibacillus sp. Aloe-11]
MTITLNNQEVVNLTTTEIPYHADLTIEKLCYFLDISSKAEILITEMKFMLNTVERMNEFLQRSTFANHPLYLLVQMRKEDIDAYGYTVKATFVYDYYRNKKAAFEKLFQEPAHEWKMDRYETDDPELIYDTYLKLGKYSHMTEVAMFA